MDEYRTPAKEAAAELTEKRSRFIGHVKPVCSQEEAVAFIRSIKTEHREASHNCFAYCVLKGQARRCSDDGEPQGTAGVPLLEVLTKSGVTDAAVVVTRYFGGVLLGAGGLVRAYSHAASLALAQAGIRTMKPFCLGRVVCDYSYYGKIAALVSGSEGVVEETVYTDQVTVCFRVPRGKKEPFQVQLSDATCGRCEAQWLYEKFFAD